MHRGFMLAIVKKKKQNCHISHLKLIKMNAFSIKTLSKMEECIYLNYQRLEIKSLTLVSSLLAPMWPLLGLLMTLVAL